MGIMVAVNPVTANPSTAVCVDPSSIKDTTKTAGTNFTINVVVKDVTNLLTFEFTLKYDKNVLTATNISLGSFFPSDSRVWTYKNDVEGYVYLKAELPSGSTVGVSGNGTLATISFTITALGASILDLYNTILLNFFNQKMDHTVYDGYFVNEVAVTKFYVDPPNIIDTTKTAGTNFTVNINVKDTIDLFGFNLKLIYDTTLLNVNTVTVGSFFPPSPAIFHNETNEELGFIWFAVYMPTGSKVGVSGSGTLLTINFNVTSTGETILDLESYRWEIVNSKLKLIAHNLYDGYFSNIFRPTRLYVDPKNTINPDLVAGKNFTINVNILNATALYGFEFFLNYTTTVLTATNVTLGPFSSGSQIVHEEINDILGYVRYNVTMPGVIGDGILANITFTVDSIGESRLDLCNTKLVDSSGQRIEHDTMDGYFSNKPIFHDIAITNITTTVTTVEVEDGISFSVSKQVSEVYAGEKVNVTVFVKNNGTISETFNVTAYYDDTLIGTLENVTLSEGFKTSFVFEWNTEGVEVGNHTIWAEVSPVPGETPEDKNNNKFTMEGVFKVLGHSPPLELFIAAAAIVSIIAVTSVYFLKFRKPKPVAEGTLSESKG